MILKPFQTTKLLSLKCHFDFDSELFGLFKQKSNSLNHMSYIETKTSHLTEIEWVILFFNVDLINIEEMINIINKGFDIWKCSLQPETHVSLCYLLVPIGLLFSHSQTINFIDQYIADVNSVIINGQQYN